jgi:6-phosphogluconolactonase
LFPCSQQIQEGIDLDRRLSAIATQPTTAPYQRMSMSLAKIVSSKHVFLHLTGDKKRQVLNDAIANHTILEKPIKAVCDNTTVTLMWAG